MVLLLKPNLLRWSQVQNLKQKKKLTQLTNIFLQELYKCATSGKASEPYVNKVLGKGDPEPEKKQPEKKEEKKEIKKPQRPPSAARLAKKPSDQPQPSQPQAKKPAKQE